MRPTTTKTVLAVAVLALTGGACSGDAVTDEKAGGDVEPVTLRIGNVGNPRIAYADELEHFAEAVENGSDGSLIVDVVYEVGQGGRDAEQKLATMVSTGEIELALVPTRQWDALGVTSFDALHAPFLVDDLGLLGEIAQSELAAKMLEGLTSSNVEGLALWPESLRHPVSFGEPLLTTSDFEGAKFSSTPLGSNIVAAMGAEPVSPEDPAAAVAAGELAGQESAFIWAHELPRYGAFTANITLYPKANTIVANTDFLDALSDDQREVIRREAAATVGYVIETNSPERDLAVQYCADGGSVVLADAAVVAELVTLAEPVYAELANDADTARLLDEIRALKGARTGGADLPEACQPVAAEPSLVVSDEVFPEGVYRAEHESGEIVTFEFRDGTWKRYFESGDLDCVSTYSVISGRIHLTHSTDSQFACGSVPGEEFLDAAWTLEGDQLRILDINSDPVATAEFSLPWTKIE